MADKSGRGKARILTLLQNGEKLTAKDAASRAFVSERVAREILGALHDDQTVHICDYRRDAAVGPWMAIFCFGPGEDAIRPNRISGTDKYYRRAASKAARDIEEARLASLRCDLAQNPGPDPVSAALFPWLYASTNRSAFAEGATA